MFYCFDASSVERLPDLTICLIIPTKEFKVGTSKNSWCNAPTWIFMPRLNGNWNAFVHSWQLIIPYKIYKHCLHIRLSLKTLTRYKRFTFTKHCYYSLVQVDYRINRMTLRIYKHDPLKTKSMCKTDCSLQHKKH